MQVCRHDGFLIATRHLRLIQLIIEYLYDSNCISTDVGQILMFMKLQIRFDLYRLAWIIVVIDGIAR